MNSERGYYEQGEFWAAARYLEDFEEIRLAECRRMLPAHIATHLDVGAGNGAFLAGLEGTASSARRFGAERSAAAVRAAVCKSPLVVADATALPFGDRCIDVVSALDVVEHLPFGTYERALAEIARVAGSYILLNVPFRERRLHAVCPYCSCRFDPHYHMRRFDSGSFGSLFPGFEVAASHQIQRAESFLEVGLRSLRRTVFGKFPGHGVCPQCGYRRNAVAGGSATPAGESWRDLVRRSVRALPKIKTAVEIAVLYRRIGTIGQ